MIAQAFSRHKPANNSRIGSGASICAATKWQSPHRRWEWGTAATLSTHDAVVKLNIAPAGIPLPPLHVNVTGRDVKLAAAPFVSAQRWSLRSTLAVRKVRVPSPRKESGSRGPSRPKPGRTH